MLATRIIPTLCCRGRELVKGERFDAWRSVGHVMQAARIHGMRQVDELVLLDISATPENRLADCELVSELALQMATPLAVGGGVVTVEDVNRLLRAGADKVVVGTTAHKNPWLLSDMTKHFGGQAIVASLDVRQCGMNSMPPEYSAFFNCGMNRGLPAVEMAKVFESKGVGEILLTSIDREGGMCGYDLELIRKVAHAVDIPVIAHGGCGSFEHMLEALTAGAHAVAAGAFFQFSDATPADAARYLHDHGVEVRLPKEATPC